ncbi:MAG: glycosyltransferase family A protein [Pseudanabaena sp. ELA645]|jgi:glycosyltransferase involved in cell wall biosynthesis
MGAENLEIKKNTTSNVGKFVSVIIPVYNDSEPLKICLEALENQTYPKDLYEVIVVDNGSDATQDIKRLVSHFDQAETFYESFPSSYAARNKGLQKAKGQIIAFTDADCIPDPNWIQNGVRNLLQVPNCGLVAGKIDIFFRDSHRPTAIELYESIIDFDQEYFLKNSCFGMTANIFTFKEVIENVGDFNRPVGK